MKRTLFAICITSLALAVGVFAEEQNPNRTARGERKAAARSASTSTHVNSAGNARTRQFSAQQNTSARSVNRHSGMNAQQNTSARSFNRHSGVNAHTNTEASVARSNQRFNRVTTRERGFRRGQATTNNGAVSNGAARERFGRGQNIQRERTISANTNRNVTINRTRNINRNVTLVNNWRSDRFSGRPYVAFRNYQRSWHDRGWWRNHCDRIVFVSGGWYFWNSGYWYPAWGYDPGYAYPYDGPIYGYNSLSPDQVVVNVQAQLRDDGYYTGPIDGVLGPETRYALAAFQADHGLAVTSAVDEPTLSTLGLV
jgi:hypothetical protein